MPNTYPAVCQCVKCGIQWEGQSFLPPAEQPALPLRRHCPECADALASAHLNSLVIGAVNRIAARVNAEQARADAAFERMQREINRYTGERP